VEHEFHDAYAGDQYAFTTMSPHGATMADETEPPVATAGLFCELSPRQRSA
jgi:hypothetical protein